jgi:protein phosphatase
MASPMLSPSAMMPRQMARTPEGPNLGASKESEVGLVSQSHGLSDRGLERDRNEDHFLIATLTTALRVVESSLDQQRVRYSDADAQLLIVADGMGGHAGGAEASALAVGAIEDFLLHSLRWLFALGRADEEAERDVLEDFKAALYRADASVCEAAHAQPALKGMGTTLTMAFSIGSTLYIAHVGDSRCYVLRAGGLHQMTRDHTLVRDLVERGVIAEDVAAEHEFRHVVTNAVGGERAGVRVEVHSLALQPGDVVILCTDGLTEMLSDGEIADVLRTRYEPRSACEELVRRANVRGGRDNVTVVVSRFVGTSETALH